MHKDVFAIIPLDKPIAFTVAEPLDPTARHRPSSSSAPCARTRMGFGTSTAAGDRPGNKKTAGATENTPERLLRNLAPGGATTALSVLRSSILTRLAAAFWETAATLTDGLRLVKLFLKFSEAAIISPKPFDGADRSMLDCNRLACIQPNMARYTSCAWPVIDLVR